MKKSCLFILVLIITVGSVCAQSRDNTVLQIDNAVKTISRDIHRKLTDERADRVAVINQFIFGGSLPPLGSYWANNLKDELANMPNKSYILLSEGVTGADVIISGEIAEIADIIRIYTRLIRQNDRAILASFSSDIERNATTTAMLASSRSGGSAYVPIDAYEPDSWENPVPFEIGVEENVTIINRSIHAEGDEDFFLIVPTSNSRLVMETTGNTDTYMEFYDANTRQLLAENDDGGEDTNARIFYNVEAGKRYIAKVRGYDETTTGLYSFQVYVLPLNANASTWENPIQYSIETDRNAQDVDGIIFGGDTDFFLLIPNSNGRLVMETTGEIDTYMEFYDANTRQLLAEDDDGGAGNNAQIVYNVEAGKRYIAKIRGYSDETTGLYAFRAYILPVRAGASSWDNPIRYTIDNRQNSQVVNRTIFDRIDADFFLIIPSRSGRLLMETTGNIDTYMEFYDADTKEMLTSDDDSGEDTNALITYVVESRKRYIAKVRGYGDTTGQYGFRATYIP